MRVLVTGASGTGTTTLGQALAARTSAAFFDADSYFWLPSVPPYQSKREPSERLASLVHDVHSVESAVVAGCVAGWGRELEDCFALIVFLIVEAELRLARLKRREVERFGRANEQFLEWASQYDEGRLPGRSRAMHERWLAERKCPVLRIEGNVSLLEAVPQVVEALSNNALEADRDA